MAAYSRPLRKHGPFGIQPAYDLVRARYQSLSEVAALLGGVNPVHLKNVLAGYTRPRTIVRERLPELLDLPTEKCFTADALARPYFRYEGPAE